jgi:casein kinase 1
MERKRNPYQQGPDDTSVYGELHDQVWSYFVQEKFGKTLEDYLYTRNQPFTEKTTI